MARQELNQHHKILGADILIPMVDHCGYDDWRCATPLDWHSHEGFEIVLVIDGSVTFEFADHEDAQLTGGQYLLSMPGEVHRAAHGINSPCRMCWLVFDPRKLDSRSHTCFTNDDLTLIAETFRDAGHHVDNYPSAVKQTLDRFRRAVVQQATSHKDESNPATLRTAICQLILEIGNHIRHKGDTARDENAPAIIEFLHKHMAEGFEIEQLAERLGYSRSHIYHVFKRATGLTPNDYLHRIRITAAQERLASTDESITKIAFSIGYSSTQYFSKVFRKYTGQTPGEFRASIQK